jgi:1,4-dihydroxy-6-naphthoate synthase
VGVIEVVSLGFSPCPNDTFTFYALVHEKIQLQGVHFRETLHDVEALNHMAMRGELDVTKVSFYSLGHLLKDYCLLQSGSALGRGCGPLVVGKGPIDIKSLKGKRIAIPGRMTTAFLLLSLYDLDLRENAVSMPFERIMESVQKGEVDAGLIIHEGRFTYPLYGLDEIMDLGQWWEESTGMPIPLGGIVAKKDLGRDALRKIDSIIGESIAYAYSHPDEPLSYVKEHAQEMETDVIRKHIELYVNEFSLNMGAGGRRAVETLMVKAQEAGFLPREKMSIFCLEAKDQSIG